MILNIIVFLLICFAVYFIYGIATDKEAERQQMQNPINIEILENYTKKKNLFALFNGYLYDNIEKFKSINDADVIRKIIENDFPNYGNGLDGIDISYDLSKNDLFYFGFTKNVKLGKTFQILSIAYNNFKIFTGEIYNSNYKMRYSQGGYYSDFGDKITSQVFYVELEGAKLFVGLSSGNRDISKYVSKHNYKTESDEMYLFVELEVNNQNEKIYPHFDIINLRKDLSLNEYHLYFIKNLEISQKMIKFNV